MYWYYQTGEFEAWEPVKDRPNIQAHVRELGAIKLTILSISQTLNDDDPTQQERLTYKGPLYFDVDMKSDIVGAAQSTKRLVTRLVEEFQVPEQSIEIYASGSKGFHVIVPAKVFSRGRAEKNLPAIYAKMATELYVPGLDMGVYSAKRGVSWRLANIKRDNGKYRVQISLNELGNIQSPDDYAGLVAAPRTLTPGEIAPSAALEVLFEQCKTAAAKAPKVVAPIEDERLREHFESDIPECVEQLAKGKYNQAKNFNEVSMQIATFAARSGMPDGKAEALVARFADNAHSSKYSTERARRDHATGLWRYAKVRPSMKFSCAAMRSVCSQRPCSGCAIETVNGHQSAEDMALSVGLLVKDGGYLKLGKEQDRKISNFVLNPTDVFMQTDHMGQRVRTSTAMSVDIDGIPAGTIRFSEEGWKSKSGLIEQVSGLGNAYFVGSDADVQLLKAVTYHEGRDMGEIIEVFSAGIHIHNVAGKKQLVYVEPGGSITQFQVRNTHQLTGEIPAAPRVLDASMPPAGDEATRQALSDLLQVNAPQVVAQILGWYCAAHLRRHFMDLYNQFPILSLWGNAGSGKTVTAALFGHLNGCDYSMNDAPISLPSVSKFGLLMQCASSTTVPRLLDEFNRGRMGGTQYNLVTDILAGSWNAHSVPRGTISNSARRLNGSGRTGATSVNIPLSAPLVVMSEQRTTVPALVHRSLQVGLSIASREGRTKLFHQAFRNRELLVGFSKAMVLQTLRTPNEWVEKQMDAVDSYIPSGVTDRARYTFKVSLVGLLLFEEVCRSLNLDLAEEIGALWKGGKSHLQRSEAEIAEEKNRSEVDAIMESLALMAHATAVSQQVGGNEVWLYANFHYAMEGDFLYFDPLTAFTTYQRYAKMQGMDVHMPGPKVFTEMLKQEKYVKRTDAVHPKMPGRSNLVEIDVNGVVAKGLPTFADLFRGAYDAAV